MFHMKQLPKETLKLLDSFIDIVMKWNQKINLTSYTSEELRKIGIFDVIVLVEILKMLKISSILDIGTGYGMPGAFVKIIEPSIDVSLLDRSEKKIAFLEYVSKILNIPMNIYHKNLPDKNWHEKFECLVSKASMKESKLVEIGDSILKENGYLIYFSGPKPDLTIKRLMIKGVFFYKREVGESYIIVRKKTEQIC